MTDMTLSTRCNWCSHPIIFHSASREGWHAFFCWLNRLPRTFNQTPLKRREGKDHQAARSDRNSSNSSLLQNQPSKDPRNISDFNDTAPQCSHFAVKESFSGNNQK